MDSKMDTLKSNSPINQIHKNGYQAIIDGDRNVIVGKCRPEEVSSKISELEITCDDVGQNADGDIVYFKTPTIMDSKTEPASEAKERIEKEATNHGLRVMEYTKDFHDGINTKDAYITGATAEHNRAQEEITRLKAELERERELRKNIIDDILKSWNDNPVGLTAEQYAKITRQELERLKAKN